MYFVPLKTASNSCFNIQCQFLIVLIRKAVDFGNITSSNQYWRCGGGGGKLARTLRLLWLRPPDSQLAGWKQNLLQGTSPLLA